MVSYFLQRLHSQELDSDYLIYSCDQMSYVMLALLFPTASAQQPPSIASHVPFVYFANESTSSVASATSSPAS